MESPVSRNSKVKCQCSAEADEETGTLFCFVLVCLVSPFGPCGISDPKGEFFSGMLGGIIRMFIV